MMKPKMTNLLSNLNPQQIEAVTYEAGPLLVLAGAGSGKTRVLTFRVALLINQKRVGPDEILLLTFTNKAASEMKERVSSLVKETPGFAGTFHSFCVRLLRIDGGEIGIPRDFLIYDDTDSKEAITQIVKEINLSPDSYKPAVMASMISEAKSQMLTPSQYAEFVQSEFQEKVLKIYIEYEKFLKNANALDFDDLMLKAVSLLE